MLLKLTELLTIQVLMTDVVSNSCSLQLSYASIKRIRVIINAIATITIIIIFFLFHALIYSLNRCTRAVFPHACKNGEVIEFLSVLISD